MPDSSLDEADLLLIPHCLDSVRIGLTRLVILSNDTDVHVIAMHFVDHFRSFGLVELWFSASKKDTIRYIPLHVLADSDHQSAKFHPMSTRLLGVMSPVNLKQNWLL